MNCPNCKSEIEDNFQVCWNCSYSLTEGRVIEFEEINKKATRNVDCLRCDVKLLFSGNYKFHEGSRFGALGNLFELFVNKESGISKFA